MMPKSVNRYVAVFLTVLWVSVAMADESGVGRITGAWVPKKMGPISGGLIYAFNASSGLPPKRERSLRLPDAIAVTDDKGKFALDLPEGKYYLSTRKQFHGDGPGPPQEGDLYGVSYDGKGKLITYTVRAGRTTNIGVLRRASVYKSRTITRDKGITAIAGVVKTLEGSPLADAVVLVYANAEVKGKPLFVSQKTGKDGKYFLRVDKEGSYFVATRSVNTAGRPSTGDLYGIYGGETAQPVAVKAQEVTEGIDIKVGHFTDNRPAE